MRAPADDRHTEGCTAMLKRLQVVESDFEYAMGLHRVKV